MSDLVTKCETCQSLIDEEDLFCANCGAEAPKREQQSGAAPDAARMATHNFECSGCGASMSFDAREGNLRCPFCGSVEMVRKKDARVLAPNRVIPFKLGQEQAEAAMREWLGRGFFRPGDLSEQAAIIKMQPVYVPYWVFQATTHTYWTADTSHTPAGARGDWYPLSGEHQGSYSNLLIGASGALAPAETSQICPFDLGDGRPPEQVDLDAITVEQFSVPRKYARPLARQGLEQMEAQTCQGSYVPGRARNVHVNVRITGLSSEPVLLPVYIMAYRYNDRVFRFLVNGQNGRATGQAPISWKKIAAVVAIAAAVLLFILMLVGGMALASASRGGNSSSHLALAEEQPPVVRVDHVDGSSCRNTPRYPKIRDCPFSGRACPPLRLQINTRTISCDLVRRATPVMNAAVLEAGCATAGKPAR